MDVESINNAKAVASTFPSVLRPGKPGGAATLLNNLAARSLHPIPCKNCRLRRPGRRYRLCPASRSTRSATGAAPADSADDCIDAIQILFVQVQNLLMHL